MPKTFYTDLDIEDLVNKGATSLSIDGDNVVLTDLAFEKAKKLGLRLIYKGKENQYFLTWNQMLI